MNVVVVATLTMVTLVRLTRLSHLSAPEEAMEVLEKAGCILSPSSALTTPLPIPASTLDPTALLDPLLALNTNQTRPRIFHLHPHTTLTTKLIHRLHLTTVVMAVEEPSVAPAAEVVAGAMDVVAEAVTSEVAVAEICQNMPAAMDADHSAGWSVRRSASV